MATKSYRPVTRESSAFVFILGLAALLAACGGGSEPLDAPADRGHRITIPVDCGGGITCQ